MELWGIDLGGTKIEGVILKNSEYPEIIIRKRIPTESEKGYAHILMRIRTLLNQMKSETGLKPKILGIGTPGTLNPDTQTIKNSNTTCLIGKPLKSDLEQQLGITVRMANDANCFALAEYRMGIVKEKYPEAKVMFGVIMGTGVGGGVVVNGQVISGKQGIAGEWGHNYLDESGGDCYCGKIGCVEKIISGKSLENYHHEKFGEQKTLQQIYAEHISGKYPDSSHTINRLITYFGKAIAVVINILDPDVIVLGGGVGNIDILYTLGVEEVRKHVFNTQLDTVLLKPGLGDSAGVFGAAYLAL